MSLFGFNRVLPFPTQYDENKTPVTVDVLEAGWIVAFFVGYIGLMILLPSVPEKERIFYGFRITITSFIGLVIMVCNFGQEWEVGSVKSEMFYKAGSHEEINGTVGLKLGLRSVNITLYADPEELRGDLRGEKINYNERFYWTWVQGRAGFGPFGGQVQRDYREAQIKGIPYPILWVAEYFTFDGEGLRFGRYYRHAGWYAHIAVWCAGVCWVITVGLFKTSIRSGAKVLTILGCFLMTAAIIWCSHRNFIELEVIFNNNNLRGILRTYYGVHWYLAILTGIFCFISGIALYIADARFNDELCKFFGVNPFAILNTESVDYEELENTEAEEKNYGDIEMQEQPAFKRNLKKTIIYKGRGNKKLIATEEEPQQTFANEDYFNVENNPAMDPAYLSYEYDPNYLQAYYYHAGQHQQPYMVPIPEDYNAEYHDVLHQDPYQQGYNPQAEMLHAQHAQQNQHLHFEADHFTGQDEHEHSLPPLPPKPY